MSRSRLPRKVEKRTVKVKKNRREKLYRLEEKEYRYSISRYHTA
jgi:hypothetical protein